VTICALGAALAGQVIRAIAPWRLVTVAATVLVVYAALLAWLEGVTPGAVVRAITATAPDTAPPPGT